MASGSGNPSSGNSASSNSFQRNLQTDANGKIKRSAKNDWRLILRLVPYITRNRSQLILPMLLLVPLSLAQALQPVLIGQAISLIKQEDAAWDVFAQMSLRT